MKDSKCLIDIMPEKPRRSKVCLIIEIAVTRKTYQVHDIDNTGHIRSKHYAAVRHKNHYKQEIFDKALHTFLHKPAISLFIIVSQQLKNIARKQIFR